jgi:hypothetical protein
MNVWNRATTASLALTALVLVAVIGKLATDAYGGPLDPPAPPASTAALIEPRTPISQPATAGGFPIVISQPGSYYLATNVTGVVGKVGIEITTSNVTLDLNGFHVQGPGSSTGILVSGGTNSNIRIHSGIVQGWGAGINATIVQSGYYHDLQILNNTSTGLSASSSSYIRDMVFDNNPSESVRMAGGTSGGFLLNSSIRSANSFAIAVNGSNVVVRGVNIDGGNGQLINHGGATATGLWVDKNQTRGGNFAFVFDGNAAVVTRNTFLQAGGFAGIGTNNHYGSDATVGAGTVSSADVWSNVKY